MCIYFYVFVQRISVMTFWTDIL